MINKIETLRDNMREKKFIKLASLSILALAWVACGTMDYEESSESTEEAREKTEKDRPSDQETQKEKEEKKKKSSEPRSDEKPSKRHFDYSDSKERTRSQEERRFPTLDFEDSQATITQEEWHSFLRSLSSKMERDRKIFENRMIMLGFVTGSAVGLGAYLFYHRKLLKQFKARPARRGIKMTAISGACGTAIAALGVYGPRAVSRPHPLPLYFEEEEEEDSFEESPEVDLDRVRREALDLLPEP